jgi:3-oxoacyl-[acyl-carrier-protein] synthase II
MVAPDSQRRVVITGIGLISPLGNSLESLGSALAERRSGVAPFTLLPAENLPVGFAGEATECTESIDDFGELPKDVRKMIRKGLKVMCRETKMGVASAQRAIADAAFDEGSPDPERSGVLFGSDYMLTQPDEFTAGVGHCRDEDGQFVFTRWGDEGMAQVTPLWLLKYLPNMPASHIAIFNDLRGPNNSLTLRESSGLSAVGEAYRTIVRGDAEMMVAGATGTRVHPTKTLHIILQEEFSPGHENPESACRPFDLDRDGMVLGEGAATLVLEELQSAQQRGATIYGEVAGHATSTVLDRDFVAHRDIALANVMRGAMREAGVGAEEVGHVHAHGLSTRSCDVDEAKAINDVFGDRVEKVPVTAAKSYFGNLGAGSGIVELIASLLAIRDGRLFPVLNYETPDPECAISVATGDDVSAGSNFVTVNVTPQGQAAAVLMRAWK